MSLFQYYNFALLHSAPQGTQTLAHVPMRNKEVYIPLPSNHMRMWYSGRCPSH